MKRESDIHVPVYHCAKLRVTLAHKLYFKGSGKGIMTWSYISHVLNFCKIVDSFLYKPRQVK
jgi:hypothetical protein